MTNNIPRSVPTTISLVLILLFGIAGTLGFSLSILTAEPYWWSLPLLDSVCFLLVSIWWIIFSLSCLMNLNWVNSQKSQALSNIPFYIAIIVIGIGHIAGSQTDSKVFDTVLILWGIIGTGLEMRKIKLSETSS
ncbi:hypothetical protein IQ249_15800 [Lusitaniella coriacea LEGE 07157]|uniref:Uncharacterized protein n=1 Tax=Lusitaniella coriacea LEGE 07157 TaxID=945747 RepID=A0A8J7DZI2_9CYAN|nr:hypothetical protein [Lusitaniella coriacea]MBE9117363.1 hypothetical protein [Lusitaniella coriacea LEGE 07157]